MKKYIMKSNANSVNYKVDTDPYIKGPLLKENVLIVGRGYDNWRNWL